MKTEEQWERLQDRLPGGTAYEPPELAEELSYYDRLIESINRQTKEINFIKKIMKGEQQCLIKS